MIGQKRIILIDFDHTLFNVYEYLKDENKGIVTPKKFPGYLYKDALEFITYSKKYGDSYIFSEGDVGFQKFKIEQTGIAGIFKNNLKIYGSYAKMSNAKNEFWGKDVILIDDNPNAIFEAKKIGWKVIRVKRGKNRKEANKILPDYTVNNLRSIIKMNLLAKL